MYTYIPKYVYVYVCTYIPLLACQPYVYGQDPAGMLPARERGRERVRKKKEKRETERERERQRQRERDRERKREREGEGV